MRGLQVRILPGALIIPYGLDDEPGETLERSSLKAIHLLMLSDL
jgi:hypothetical protein